METEKKRGKQTHETKPKDVCQLCPLGVRGVD